MAAVARAPEARVCEAVSRHLEENHCGPFAACGRCQPAVEGAYAGGVLCPRCGCRYVMPGDRFVVCPRCAQRRRLAMEALLLAAERLDGWAAEEPDRYGIAELAARCRALAAEGLREMTR